MQGHSTLVAAQRHRGGNRHSEGRSAGATRRQRACARAIFAEPRVVRRLRMDPFQQRQGSSRCCRPRTLPSMDLWARSPRAAAPARRRAPLPPIEDQLRQTNFAGELSNSPDRERLGAFARTVIECSRCPTLIYLAGFEPALAPSVTSTKAGRCLIIEDDGLITRPPSPRERGEGERRAGRVAP